MGEATTARILAVDDEKGLRLLIETHLTRAGYAVTAVGTGQEFLEAVDRIAPDLCILDFALPDTDGLKLLAKLRERSPDVPAIMLTANNEPAAIVTAMKLGADDYFVKGDLDWQKIVIAVNNAVTRSSQAQELRRLRVQVRDAWTFDAIIGASPKMREAKAYAQRVAASGQTVLIRGESGTGKELFARAMHYGGPRAKGPFVDVNCAALTESLLESEIFGHEKGAFTGAAARRIGKFEQADGGTIFLDEIGDMPLATQAKLLRVLQERSFQRVGGSERVTVNVRVVSATNQPLEKAVADGRFRQDLFYRINTVTVEIPPLRDRREDVVELARHFLAVAARQEGRRAPELPPETARILQDHAWPGNVRELENAMRRAVVICEGGRVEPSHLPPQLGSQDAAAAAGPPASGNLLQAVELLERRMIFDALDRNGWVKARAARALGVTERILSYKMDSYGIVRSGT